MPARRRRLFAWAASLGLHLLLVGLLFLTPTPMAPAPEPAPEALPPPMVVSVIPPPPKAGGGGGAPASVSAPAPKAEPEPQPQPVETPVKPVAPVKVRPSPVRAPAEVKRLPIPEAPVAAGPPAVTDAQLASAATADSGGGGSGVGAGSGDGAGDGPGSGRGAGDGSGQTCDMIRYLQTALRKSAAVRAAVTRASQAPGAGKAVMVWDGDWSPSQGEDGRGLASVRQAIIVEVGFAPEQCRRQPMQGLVLISLAEGPGAPRLVLGDARWKWSDLLFARGAVQR